ncbi:MAG: hypothetical protein HRT45_13820 [Bdellovibrionales bacterium]|nr:hypothetical protein [Bdellovibrionales bacterium]
MIRFALALAMTLPATSQASGFYSYTTCTGHSFSVEFELRPHQDTSNSGLVKYAFDAKEVISHNDDGTPVYSEEELFVNMAYLMNRDSQTQEFIGSVSPVDSFDTVYVKAFAEESEPSQFHGEMTFVRHEPQLSVISEAMSCKLAESVNPD